MLAFKRWYNCLPLCQAAYRMQRLTYIQIPVQTLMDSKDPEEGIPVYDKKVDCVRQRHDGEQRNQITLQSQKSKNQIPIPEQLRVKLQGCMITGTPDAK